MNVPNASGLAVARSALHFSEIFTLHTTVSASREDVDMELRTTELVMAPEDEPAIARISLSVAATSSCTRL